MSRFLTVLKNSSEKRDLPKYFLFSVISVAFLFLGTSCSTVDCPSCKEQKRESSDHNNKPRWNVALNTKIIGQCTDTEIMSIETDLKPVFKPMGPKTKNGKIDWDGKSFGDYFKERPISKLEGKIVINTVCPNGSTSFYEIPASNVLEITEKSDPLQPPVPWVADEPCVCCCRDRNGLWFFDKLELRIMAGYRGKQDTVRYSQPNGEVVSYPPKFINFDRGGSNLVFGFEIAGLWNLSQSRTFQLGFLTGVWPVDGSIYVPVGAHGRINFNQKPDPWGSNCNAFFFYGDLGLALDFQTGAPIDFNRLFWGLGVGYDMAITCGLDFSVDVGFRQMKLPLPPIECCPDVTGSDRFFYRLSKMGVLRFGLTF